MNCQWFDPEVPNGKKCRRKARYLWIDWESGDKPGAPMLVHMCTEHTIEWTWDIEIDSIVGGYQFQVVPLKVEV